MAKSCRYFYNNLRNYVQKKEEGNGELSTRNILREQLQSSAGPEADERLIWSRTTRERGTDLLSTEFISRILGGTE